MDSSDSDDDWGALPDWFGSGEEGDTTKKESYEDSNHVVVLLDAAHSQRTSILDACRQLVKLKLQTAALLRTGTRDQFGMVLYGTQPCRWPPHESSETPPPPHLSQSTVHTILPTQVPGVETIHELDRLEALCRNIEVDDDDDDDGAAWITGLRHAAQALPSNGGGGYLWIWSECLHPAGMDVAQTTLRDLAHVRDVWFWSHQPSTFYQQLGATWVDDWSDVHVLEQVWKPPRPVRVPLYLPNNDNDNQCLDVSLYKLVQVRKRPLPTKIDVRTGRPLKSVRQLVTAQGESVDQLRSMVRLGGTLIPFSVDDRNTLKQYAHGQKHAGLWLRGFVPQDSLSPHHTMEHAMVLTNLDLLASAMTRHKVLGVAEWLQKVTAPSRLVALWPMDDGNVLVVQLPYQDELREVEEESPVDEAAVPPALAAATDALVEQLTLGPETEIGVDFVNANLHRYWQYVESVALDEPSEEPVLDTVLQEDVVLERAGTVIDRMLEHLPDDQPKAEQQRPKKRKLEPKDPEWLSLYKERRLDECDNATLKNKLRSYGAKLSGKKDELVERLYERMEEEEGPVIKEEEDDPTGTIPSEHDPVIKADPDAVDSAVL